MKNAVEIEDHLCKGDRNFVYKCGECFAESITVCHLLQHLRSHVTNTHKYLFDDWSRVGYLRRETVDFVVQTDIPQIYKKRAGTEFINDTSKAKYIMTDNEQLSNSKSSMNEDLQTHMSSISAESNDEKVPINEMLNGSRRIASEKPRAENATENMIQQDQKSTCMSNMKDYSLSITFKSGTGEKKTNQCKVSKTWIPSTVFCQNGDQRTDLHLHIPLKLPGLQPRYSKDKDDNLTYSSRDQTDFTKADAINEVFNDRVHVSVESHVEKRDNPKKVLCHVCGRTFSDKKALYGHLTEQHQSLERMKTCEKCGKKFPTNSKLKDHLVVHTKERNFFCKTCGKTFPRQSTLNSHMKYFHGDGSGRKFKCSKCSKTFKYPSSFRQHVKAHDPGFKCDTCGAVFSRSSSGKRHEQIHTGIKPHSCNICGHRFIEKSAYWIHMEKHHDLTKSEVLEQDLRKNKIEG